MFRTMLGLGAAALTALALTACHDTHKKDASSDVPASSAAPAESAAPAASGAPADHAKRGKPPGRGDPTRQ